MSAEHSMPAVPLRGVSVENCAAGDATVRTSSSPPGAWGLPSLCTFPPAGRILRQLWAQCSPHSLGLWLSPWEQALHCSSLYALQMNGTRPGTASTKLSPWDKSSHSAHRVDLSAV